MKKKRITVIIAEPNESIRFGIRVLLESNPDLVILAEAGLASETVFLVKKLKPSVLLLEWRMPDSTAAGFLPKISEFSPTTKTIIVSTWKEADFDVPLQHKDLVSGYVWKHESEHLLTALRQAAAGGVTFISPLLGETLKKSKRKRQKPGRR